MKFHPSTSRIHAEVTGSLFLPLLTEHERPLHLAPLLTPCRGTTVWCFFTEGEADPFSKSSFPHSSVCGSNYLDNPLCLVHICFFYLFSTYLLNSHCVPEICQGTNISKAYLILVVMDSAHYRWRQITSCSGLFVFIFKIRDSSPYLGGCWQLN